MIISGSDAMELNEKTISMKTVFKGRVINLRTDQVTLPNGRIAGREVIEHSGGVGIVAITNHDEILLVNQWRYPFSSVLKEIPAGKLDLGENPVDCAFRELREETGAVAKEVTPLGKMLPSPGYTNEVIYLYYAKDLEMLEQQLDQDEFLLVEKVPFDEALAMVYENRITDAKTIIGILKANELRKTTT